MRRAVLFDVDGTLLDVIENLRLVWAEWAKRHGLDPEAVYRVAVTRRPMDTFAIVAPSLDPADCLAALHEIEDADASSGTYVAFRGAAEILTALAPGDWGVVTSNYAHRVEVRFARTGLPLPDVVVDAAAVAQGKPHPEGYLQAASRLGVDPRDCLALEDGLAGITAALEAGLTAWAVNVAPNSHEGRTAHRTYSTLDLARDDILSWVTS